MKSTKKLLGLSMLGISLNFSSLAYGQDAIGVNAAVKGDVTIISAGQKAKQAIIKEDVFLGEQVNSKKLSSLQIMLKDQTVFTVGPDCDLTIDKFVYDPSKSTNSMSATVSKGMFRFMSGKISKSGVDAVNINTPVSSMGIRGTMVEGLIGPNAIKLAQAEGIIPAGTALDQNGATVITLRGPGENTSGTNTKGEISITSGKHTEIVTGSRGSVFVPYAGAAPITFSISAIGFANFTQGVGTTPTGPQNFNSFKVESYPNSVSPTTTNPSASTSTTSAGTTSSASATGSSAAGAGTAGAGTAAGATGLGIGAVGAVGAGVAGAIIVVEEVTDDNDDEPVSP